MEKAITINQKIVSIREYNGQRVITFRDIDTVHERPEGTASRNFRANRKHFIEGVDYFRRNSSQANSEYGIPAPNGLILITESGYLMLAKSFTDDLAWEVQRQLVNTYFKAKALTAYPVKSTSVGEVASLLKILTKDMEKAGHSREMISTMVQGICQEFGIPLPDGYIKKNPFVQLSLLVTEVK